MTSNFVVGNVDFGTCMVGVRVGGAVSMNPPTAAPKEFPPLPPAPDETPEQGDSESTQCNV